MTSIDLPTETQLPNFDRLWNYGNPAGTEQKFREILQNAEVSGDKEYLAQLLTQIARCEGLQSKFEAAHSTLDIVGRLLTNNDLGVANVRYLLERGRAFNSDNRAKSAMPLFIKAYEVAMSKNQTAYAIDAIHMIAIAESNPRKQVEWNLKAIEIAESAPLADKRAHGWLEPLCNNIGESYLLLNEYESAHKYFVKLGELEAVRTGAASIYTIKDQAKALRLLEKPDESISLMEQVLNSLLLENKDNGYIRMEMAEDLLTLGKTDESKQHFAKAFELLSQDEWVIKNEPTKLARMKKLSR